MSVFLSEHGFGDGKEHYINARLVAKGEDLIIRMRDNCEPLDLMEYYQLMSKGNDINVADISLPIIFKASKDVKYASAFGANNVIIRV